MIGLAQADASVKLLIVDDHEIVREGLRSLFARVSGIDVVGEAESVVSAVEAARRLVPDVVLMDLRLSGGSGVDACREIVATLPQSRVLFLTSYHDDEAVLSAVFAGARGYLLKEIGGEVLIDAIKAVAQGHSILDPLATRIVLDRMRAMSSIVPPAGEGYKLSEQERRVLALVAAGKTNKEIAAALELSEKTVKNYLSNVFQKLHITRRAQAASIYSKNLIR